jgi:feruloyl esterase
VADGLLEDSRKCTFDPSVLLCSGADNERCLTAAQVDTTKKLYSPLIDPRTQEQIYPGYSRGGEAGWTAFTAANVPLALPFFRNIVFEDRTWTFDRFDLGRDGPITSAKVGEALNTNRTDYAAAKAHGAKVIMYHGWNDPQPQPEYTVQLYEKIAAANGGIDRTKDFWSLFMVPGMAHCAFGPGATSFGGAGQQSPPMRDSAHDVQAALEAWVEKGVAPDRLIATKYTDDLPTTRTIKSTRLLCSYPQVAKYKGTGDTGDAANFQCALP